MEVAHKIDNAIQSAGVISTVCFRERYRPIFQEARKRLEGQKIVHVRFQSVSGLPALQQERKRILGGPIWTNRAGRR